MPDGFSIKDLPETSKIDDKKSYLVQGKWLRAIVDILQQLWRGENVGKGPNIRIRQNGLGGYTITGADQSGPQPVNNQAWPWKVYNTSVGSMGRVQINGGDGFVASLNGFVANVNSNPNDTPLSGPPNVYPQLAVTGNGVIYGYAVPATAGAASSLAPGSGSLDIFYAGTLPALDTANPNTFFPFLIATITNYAVTGDKVSFSVNNATTVGWDALIYCGGVIQIGS
jgi:hypothetical protein